MFLSRDMESLNKSLMLRLIALLVACSDYGTVQTAITSIHERLIDSLNFGPQYLAEVRNSCIVNFLGAVDSQSRRFKIPRIAPYYSLGIFVN